MVSASADVRPRHAVTRQGISRIRCPDIVLASTVPVLGEIAFLSDSVGNFWAQIYCERGRSMAGHENSVVAFPESPFPSQFLSGIEAFGDQLGLVSCEVIRRPGGDGDHGSFLFW